MHTINKIMSLVDSIDNIILKKIEHSKLADGILEEKIHLTRMATLTRICAAFITYDTQKGAAASLVYAITAHPMLGRPRELYKEAITTNTKSEEISNYKNMKKYTAHACAITAPLYYACSMSAMMENNNHNLASSLALWGTAFTFSALTNYLEQLEFSKSNKNLFK